MKNHFLVHAKSITRFSSDLYESIQARIHHPENNPHLHNYIKSTFLFFRKTSSMLPKNGNFVILSKSKNMGKIHLYH